MRRTARARSLAYEPAGFGRCGTKEATLSTCARLLLLGFELLSRLALHHRRADLGDARRLDELGQLERRLLDAALPLQKVPLLTPVLRHRHAIAVRFQHHEESWVGGRHVPLLHDLGPGHELLELGDGEPLKLPRLFARHLLIALLRFAVCRVSGCGLGFRICTIFSNRVQQLLSALKSLEDAGEVCKRRVGRHFVVRRDVLDLDRRLLLLGAKGGGRGEAGVPAGEGGAGCP